MLLLVVDAHEVTTTGGKNSLLMPVFAFGSPHSDQVDPILAALLQM